MKKWEYGVISNSAVPMLKNNLNRFLIIGCYHEHQEGGEAKSKPLSNIGMCHLAVWWLIVGVREKVNYYWYYSKNGIY